MHTFTDAVFMHYNFLSAMGHLSMWPSILSSRNLVFEMIVASFQKQKYK